ncbi:MAG TPA: Nif3-like dinuclear metal center hexameric protein [Clostridia bacterium]
MQIKDIIQYLNIIAPPEQKEDWDNIGLIVGNSQDEVTIALLCLDVTIDVIQEAKNLGAQLIISHHPFIFRPISSITNETFLGKKILEVIKSGISVFSAHTNLDASDQGINAYIAELLELNNVKRFDLLDSTWQGGRMGELKEPMTLKQLARKVQEVFNDDMIRYSGNAQNQIKKIAFISGGAGKTDYIDAAISRGIDCYISADFNHHSMLEAYEKDFPVIYCSHYYMERIILKRLKELLNQKFDGVEFILSTTEQNPMSRL